MEYISLGKTDLQVSRLCMGGCPMGGYGWGDVQEQELLDAVSAALDAGVNFFDTADTYGLGQSERTLGKALAGRRDKAVIATKFGVRVENGKTFYDNSPQYVRKACEDSLMRLGTDYIDLYQIHYRDGVSPLGEVVATLEALRQEGKVRYFGLSNVHAEDLEEIRACGNAFQCFQDEYSLACRKNEQDMRLLAADGMTPLTWGSLGQGVLTGKYDRTAAFAKNDRRSREIYVNFHGEKLLKNLDIVDAMRPIAAAHGVSIAAVAVRFILDYIHGSAVLVGAKRPSQILGSAEAAAFRLSKEELVALDEVSE